MLSAFSGVVLLSITKSESKNQTEYYVQIISIMLVIYTSITIALLNIFLRVFNKYHSFYLYGFYYAVNMALLSFVLLIFYPNVYHFSEYDLYCISMFLASGIFNIISQSLASYALKLDDAAFLAPLFYLFPVTTFIFDVTLFEYSFSFLDIIGAMIVMFFLLLKLRITNNESR